MLCYVCTISISLYGKSDSDIAEKFDWRMHAYALALPLCTAIGELEEIFLKLMDGTVGLVLCQQRASFLTLLTSAWTFINGATILVSMVMTYRAVQSTENRMNHYRFTPNATREERGLEFFIEVLHSFRTK